MRAAARLLFWRENRLYRQTEGTACGSPFSYSQQQRKSPALFFRSDGAIALHRMAAHWQRCRSRKVNSGRQCVPQSPRRPEPRPRVPRFAAHLRCVSAKEGLGSQEGTGNHTWCPVPFCPPPWVRRLRRETPAIPPPPKAAIPRRCSPAFPPPPGGGNFMRNRQCEAAPPAW